MTGSEVHEIAGQGVYENALLRGEVEETHISWIILTKQYAFKIKKPLSLDFLDFSTLELRRQMCERELMLNRRFSDIYLDVLPIRFIDNRWVIGRDDPSEVIDYCVLMRKMDVSKRLDRVLRRHSVNERPIKALAALIADFHSSAQRIFIPFEIEKACQTFNDIDSITLLKGSALPPELTGGIKRAIEWSDSFLLGHQDWIQQRIESGFKRDIHGDLHCGNIFLYNKPVLFDCIEFNDEFRQIDVLYELAFLCMDLERFRQKNLAEIILHQYTKRLPAFQKNVDHDLFLYYKSLRANIRAKVHALQWRQADTQREALHHLSETRNYLNLMNEYMSRINSGIQF